MVKVRILSGNQTGNVVDLDKDDAEVNVATGYAVYVDPPAPKHVPTPTDDDKTAEAPKPKASKKKTEAGK